MQKRKRRLLIVTTSQFGYLIDTYKYCQYCQNEFEITYLCWDYGKTKLHLSNTDVIYVSRNGSLPQRNFRLLLAVHREIARGYDVVFCPYVRGISLVKLFNIHQKFVFDVRTLSVQTNLLKRRIYNLFLNLESLPFKYVTTVSQGVANQLFFKKSELLPLGADPIIRQKVHTGKFNLLYVGTLQGRNIIEAVKGFKSYIDHYERSDLHFIIVGDSPDGELEEINRFVQHKKLQDVVTLTGRIKHQELEKFFNIASIGVSFIPMTKWYQHQPPTKTYEYLLAGLPVLATRTFENAKVINESNGVLISDDAKGFFRGLETIIKNFGNYTNKPPESYDRFTWAYIAQNNFRNLIAD